MKKREDNSVGTKAWVRGASVFGRAVSPHPGPLRSAPVPGAAPSNEVAYRNSSGVDLLPTVLRPGRAHSTAGRGGGGQRAEDGEPHSKPTRLDLAAGR